MKIIVFDTETSGLPSTRLVNPTVITSWPHILQFSYIVYDIETHKLIKSFDSLVKISEHVTIDPKSIEIHGIKKENCIQEGRDIADIVAEFMTDLNQCKKLIGHNVEFDRNMVIIEMMRNDLFETYMPILNEKKYFCTMKNTVRLCNIEIEGKDGKFKKFPKLAELHKKLFYFEPKHLHNSLHDILITLRCYVKMKTYIDVVLVDDELRKLIKPLVD